VFLETIVAPAESGSLSAGVKRILSADLNFTPDCRTMTVFQLTKRVIAAVVQQRLIMIWL
jgi:hypothetical protein